MAGISKINRPLDEDFSSFQKWLRDPKGGNSFLDKNHNAETCLYKPFDPTEELALSHDLFTLSPEQDLLARLLRKWPLHWYHALIGQHLKNRSRIVDEESQSTLYEDYVVDRSAIFITTVVSSILPLVAIIILNHWERTRTRVYISIGLTVIFVFVLALFTSARRVEIFAATST